MTERAIHRPSEGARPVNMSHAWFTLLDVNNCPLCLSSPTALGVLSPLVENTLTGRAVLHTTVRTAAVHDASFVESGNVRKRVLPIRLLAAIGLTQTPEFSRSCRMP